MNAWRHAVRCVVGAIRSPLCRARLVSSSALPLDTSPSQLPLRDLTLRPYQETCVQKALDAIASGHRRIGISAPTGSGKTLMIAAVIERLKPLRDEATKNLVVVSGRELSQQVTDQLKRLLPEKSVELEQGTSRASGSADITVATIQSLHRRLDAYDPKRFKILIVDEAHHAAAATYIKALEHFDPGTQARFEREQARSRGITAPEADTSEVGQEKPYIMGFTATFTRSDRLSLRRAFDYIAHHVDLKDLIDQKWLSDVSFESVSTLADLSRVAVSTKKSDGEMGDFEEASLSEELSQPRILNEVVQCWKERAAQRRSCLVFAVDVRHTIALLEAFRQAGVSAGYIIGEMKASERQQVMQLFRNGTIPVLVNCNVLTEGTDIPEIDTVILARPTRSKSRYWQMIGRGLRISPQSGKTDCLVLDFQSTFPGLIHWPALVYDDARPPGDGREREEREAEEAAERSVLQEGPPRTLDDIKLDFDVFDPFALSHRDVAGHAERSPFAWVACGPTKWVLEAHEHGRLRVDKSGGHFSLWFRHGKRYSLPELVASDLSFEQAIAQGDQFARTSLGTHVCQTLLSKEARWRSDPPTRKQINLLRKLLRPHDDLLPRPESLNKGELACAMTALQRGGKKGLIKRLEFRKAVDARKAKADQVRRERTVPLLAPPKPQEQLDTESHP